MGPSADEDEAQAFVTGGDLPARHRDDGGVSMLIASTHWRSSPDDYYGRWLRKLLVAVTAQACVRAVPAIDLLMTLTTLCDADDSVLCSRLAAAVAGIVRASPGAGGAVARNVRDMHPWHTRPAQEHASHVRVAMALCDALPLTYVPGIVGAVLCRLLLLDIELAEGQPAAHECTAERPAGETLEEAEAREDMQRRAGERAEGTKALDTCVCMLASYLSSRLADLSSANSTSAHGTARDWPPKTRKALRDAILTFYTSDVVASPARLRGVQWVPFLVAARNASFADALLGHLFRPLLAPVSGPPAAPAKRARPIDRPKAPLPEGPLMALPEAMSAPERDALFSAARHIGGIVSRLGPLPAGLMRLAVSLLVRLGLRLRAENAALGRAGRLVSRVRRDLLVCVCERVREIVLLRGSVVSCADASDDDESLLGGVSSLLGHTSCECVSPAGDPGNTLEHPFAPPTLPQVSLLLTPSLYVRNPSDT